MAASIQTLKWLLFKPHLTLTRFQPMSQYGPQFVKPVFRKEDQQTLVESGEDQTLMHMPIRAALNDQTSSVLYDEKLRKFVNYVMKGGNKVLARDLVEKTFEKIKRIQIEKYHKTTDAEEKSAIEIDPLKIFYTAVENCKPILMLTPIKRGGATYQVPVPITQKRSQFVSMKWLIEAAHEKDRKIHFPEKLAWELIEAHHNTGRVVKRKQELHKQCEANRAYAHYRWS